MSDQRGTLDLLARQLVAALEPLRRAVTDEHAFRALMLRLGWQAAGLPPAYTAIGESVAEAAQAIDALGDKPSPDANRRPAGQDQNRLREHPRHRYRPARRGCGGVPRRDRRAPVRDSVDRLSRRGAAGGLQPAVDAERHRGGERRADGRAARLCSDALQMGGDSQDHHRPGVAA